MKTDFFFDFETRSRLDLRNVGAVKYATHSSTEATLLTWAFGHGPVKAWRYGQPIPDDLADVCLNPCKYNMVAHNMAFDYMIWTVPWMRQLERETKPLVKPQVADLTDSMGMTSQFGCGAALDGAAKVLHMPISKDKEGRRIMLKQCKPGRNGEFPTLTPEEWNKFEHYGIIDTELMRQIYYKIPKLPFEERYAWEWTFKRNLRGLRVDTDLLGVMEAMLVNDVPKIDKEYSHIVGYTHKVNQRAKCLAWLKQYYPHLENLQKESVRETLAGDYNVPPHARRALELKALASNTSIAKVKAFLDKMHAGRIYEILKYHEAHTKRWAGKGVQIQNFPRAEKIPGLEMNVSNLAAPVLDLYHQGQCGINLTKNLLRRLWIPDGDMEFYCGDFGKVEPTVLFWLTGLGAIPKLWYEEMAAEIFNKQVSSIDAEGEERQLGKAAALGCGYGLGAPTFQTQVKDQAGLVIDINLAKRAVYAYRRKYVKVVELWRALEWGFKAAIGGQTVSLCEGKVHIGPITQGASGVQIRLPSGAHLYYHDARMTPDGPVFTKSMGTGTFQKNVYGGLLCENVCSAIGRELMLAAMYKLEQAGFDILNTIHDEVWGQAEPGRGKEYERVMCTLPRWAKGLQLGVDSKNGVRYLK